MGASSARESGICLFKHLLPPLFLLLLLLRFDVSNSIGNRPPRRASDRLIRDIMWHIVPSLPSPVLPVFVHDGVGERERKGSECVRAMPYYCLTGLKSPALQARRRRRPCWRDGWSSLARRLSGLPSASVRVSRRPVSRSSAPISCLGRKPALRGVGGSK